jgi:hypothetical protein
LQRLEEVQVPASFNLGVWRQSDLPDGVLYRWAGDEGRSGTGFVLLDAERETIRPADAQGQPVGDLSVDCRSRTSSGAAAGIDEAAFMQVVAALLRARARVGAVPETAHAIYG